MHNMIKRYITTPGTYAEVLPGITVVRCGGVNITGVVNSGDCDNNIVGIEIILIDGDGTGVGMDQICAFVQRDTLGVGFGV